MMRLLLCAFLFTIYMNVPLPAAGAVAPSGPLLDRGWQGVALPGPKAGYQDDVLNVVQGGPGLVALGETHPTADVGGTFVMWTSVDGLTWTRLPLKQAIFPQSSRLYGLAATPTEIAIVGDRCCNPRGQGTVWTSTDGRTWHYRTLNPHQAIPYFVTRFGESFVVSGREVGVGSPNERGIRVWRLDATGLHEAARAPGFDGSYPTALAATGSGLLLAAFKDAGDLATQPPEMWASSDGTQWQRETLDPSVFPAGGRISLIQAGDGRIVAQGTRPNANRVWEPTLWISSSGTSWHRLASPNLLNRLYAEDVGVWNMASNGPTTLSLSAGPPDAYGTPIYSIGAGGARAVTQAAAFGPGYIALQSMTSFRDGFAVVGQYAPPPASCAGSGAVASGPEDPGPASSPTVWLWSPDRAGSAAPSRPGAADPRSFALSLEDMPSNVRGWFRPSRGRAHAAWVRGYVLECDPTVFRVGSLGHTPVMAPDGILSGGLDSVSREAGRPSIYGFEFAHLSNCGVDFCELSAAVSGLSVVTGSAAQAARFLNHAGRLFSASHAKRPGTPVGQATRIFTAGGVVWRHGRWVGVIAASGEKESALLTLARKQLSRLMQRER